MTQLETLLQNDPKVQQFALAVLNECEDMRGFAASCVAAMINSAMSAQADEACGANYNERSEPCQDSGQSLFRSFRLPS